MAVDTLDEFEPMGTIDSHFVQKALLNNFANQVKGKSKVLNKVYYIDFKNKTVGRRNTKSTYHKKGLYSDELEKELSIKIEEPAIHLIGRALKSKEWVRFSLAELNLLRKYLLIQAYRNPSNLKCYSPDNPEDVLGVNKASLKEGENYREPVFDKMMEILNHSWEELLTSENDEVKRNAIRENNCTYLFVRTSDEFLINDSGLVTEVCYAVNRDAFETPQTIEFVRNFLISSLNREPTSKELEEQLAREAHFDNYHVYPIGHNTAIISIESIWALYLEGLMPKSEFDKYGLVSNFIENRYQSPIPERKGLGAGKVKESILYPIIPITREETDYLNCLTLNEARQFVSFKTPGKLSSTFEYYRVNGTKHDISWLKDDAKWNDDGF